MRTVIYAAPNDNLPLLIEMAANGNPEIYHDLGAAVNRACEEKRSILIVSGPERISRGLSDFCSICERLHNAGCQIYTPIGKINPFDRQRASDVADLIRSLRLEELPHA